MAEDEDALSRRELTDQIREFRGYFEEAIRERDADLFRTLLRTRIDESDPTWQIAWDLWRMVIADERARAATLRRLREQRASSRPGPRA